METSPATTAGAAPLGPAGALDPARARAALSGLAAFAWPAAALLILFVSLAPFLVVDVPAVLDYPNHLARFFILAHPHDPILSRMYAPHWSVLPNLGMDLIGRALLGLLPVHVGGRILLALSLIAPPLGTTLYARAAFGRWTWWSLGAGAIAYNAIFFLGFMNFLLGLGVALAGAAAWRVLRRQGRNRMAVAAGAAIGVCAFFCHLMGFGFFALLIGAEEMEPLARRWRGGARAWRIAAQETLQRAALLALALAPAAALYLLSHHQGERSDLPGWHWSAKAVLWLTPFMTYSTLATVVTASVVMGAAVLLWRRAEVATGALAALLALAGLYLVAPAAAGGGTFVDARLPLMAALVLFAGLRPRPSAGAARVVGLAFALLIAGRAAVVAQSWIGHARDLADLRAELAYVPQGASILPAWTGAPRGEETRGRELPRFMLINDELAAIAVIERRAFWPLEFADPAQQPMVVRPAYRSRAEPMGWTTQWARLYDDPPTPRDLAEHPYLTNWRRAFDFVLLVGPRAPGPPPAGLTLVRGADAVSLYRILR